MRSVSEKQGAALLAVLNATPDSFFDGGRHAEPQAARARIDALLESGADLIDIGAESTRPGSTPVPARVQIERAGPAIEYAVARGALVSIDTTLPEVAEAGLMRGARIINDVSCLSHPSLARLARDHDADLIIMHSRGSMSRMNTFSVYDERAYADVVDDVRLEWNRAFERATAEGLSQDRIWFDPGLGFHKSAEHSCSILRRLEELSGLGAGLVVGASRKSFIGALDGSAPEERLGGSIAAAIRSVDAGATVLRVHDVAETRQALIAHRVFFGSNARSTSPMHSIGGESRVLG